MSLKLSVYLVHRKWHKIHKNVTMVHWKRHKIHQNVTLVCWKRHKTHQNLALPNSTDSPVPLPDISAMPTCNMPMFTSSFPGACNCKAIPATAPIPSISQPLTHFPPLTPPTPLPPPTTHPLSLHYPSNSSRACQGGGWVRQGDGEMGGASTWNREGGRADDVSREILTAILQY